MSDQNHKKQDSGNGINPVAAAVTGAVVGAVVGAGAVVMSDKNKREEVKNALNDVKDKAEEYVQDVQDKVEDTKKNVEEKLSNNK